MDDDDLLNLTDSEKAYFAEYEELFSSPAWQRLQAGWKNDLDAIPQRAFWNAQSWDEILAARALCQKLQEYLRTPGYVAVEKANVIELREQLESDKLDSPDV